MLFFHDNRLSFLSEASDGLENIFSNETRQNCFAALRRVRHLHQDVTDDCFLLLLVSLVHVRLDYSNFVLVGLPAYIQSHLQAVLNTSACLVCQLLATLHWLRLPEGLTLKPPWWRFQCFMVWRCHRISWFLSWSLSSAFINITVTTRPGMPSCNCQPSLVSSCCIHHLELSTSWRSVISFSVCFLPVIKVASVS